MGGVIGQILARFLTTKFDSKLGGKVREVYKKGILVGKQQYIIVKPLNIIMALLAIYTLLFQLSVINWLLQSVFVALGALFIFLGKPKFAVMSHILVLIVQP